MDITVYLPDEIGTRAREQGLNLSRLLQDAVEIELAHRDAMATLLHAPQTYRLDADGTTHRLVGTKIVEDGDLAVFLTEDERIFLHDAGRLQLFEIDEDWDPPLALRGFLSDAAYEEAMRVLGIRPLRDL